MGEASSGLSDRLNQSELVFLPQPWRVERDEGWFLLDAATPIRFATGSSDATRRTARGLQAAIAAQTGLTPPLQAIEPDGAKRRTGLDLVLVGRDEQAFPTHATSWLDPSALGPQGSTLAVGETGATVAATTEAGLFYGLQTLIQLAKNHNRRWPAVRIEDKPALPVRGLMLDVSRGKVPTMATLRHLIETLAHYKFNQLQLYIEHTFRFPSHPEPAANSGALTGDEILELDSLCRANHIELIPNLQSLGHQRQFLSLPQYSHLAETDWHWSFATDSDDAFALLDELFAEFLPNFTST